MLRRLIGVTQQYVGEVGAGSAALAIQGMPIEGRTLVARGGTPPYEWADAVTLSLIGSGPEYVLTGNEVGHGVQLGDDVAAFVETTPIASATLPANPLVWLGRGDVDITAVSGECSEWRDNSLNETNAFAAGVPQRPTIVPNFNGSGRSALEFDGVSNTLTVTLAAASRSAISVYMAIRLEAAGSSDNIFELDIQLVSQAGSNYQVYAPVSPFNSILTTGGEGATLGVVHFTWENAAGSDELELFVDNTLIGTVVGGAGTSSNTTLVLGDTGGANFTLAELVVYDTLHTPAQQTIVHDYLNGRWL